LAIFDLNFVQSKIENPPRKNAMADSQTDQTQEGTGKKKGKKLLYAIVFIILVLNMALVGRIYLGRGKQATKPHKEEEEIGAKVSLEEFVVNLNSGGDHYLKTTLAVGLKKGLTEEAIKEDTPPIRDAILSVLCSKTREDLSNEDGREKLKGQLKEKINEALGSEKVMKIYFLAFATQ
jgi:flagellar FliL protein